MYQLGFEEAEEPEIKLPTLIGSFDKQGNSRKTSASLAVLKPLTVWITTNCGKFFKRWSTRPLFLFPEKTVCGSRRNSSWTRNIRLVQNWERSKTRLYCHPDYLTYMQSKSCKMPGWMNHRLESGLPGEITSDMQMTPHFFFFFFTWIGKPLFLC